MRASQPASEGDPPGLWVYVNLRIATPVLWNKHSNVRSGRLVAFDRLGAEGRVAVWLRGRLSGRQAG